MKFKTTFVIGVCMVLALLQQPTYEAVIGIDLGAEFIKVGIISPGKPFQIVENTASKRKTQNAISFQSNQRLFEGDATTKKSRSFENTFLNVPQFLGKFANDTTVREKVKALFDGYTYHVDEDRGTFAFELKDIRFKDEVDSVHLTSEEILSMILKHMKILGEKQFQVSVKDCVITTAPNADFALRRALLDAAELAGLNPLAIVSENTAAAVYYAINRNDNQSFISLFYNLGSHSLKVTLFEFKGVNGSSSANVNKTVEAVTVLADYYDDTLGGYYFDLKLANYMVEEFDKLPARKGKPSLATYPKSMQRLLREVNRLKETLSANKNAPFFVEGLLDGIDFKAHVERSVFEEKSKDLLDRLTVGIDHVLKKAGKTMADVDNFEILGGGIRIPKIQQVLTEYLNGKELGAHMNGDETMALGASFIAANLSVSFKVRPIFLYDGLPFPIRVNIRNLDESLPVGENYTRSAVLFPAKARFGTKKSLTIAYDNDVVLSFYTKWNENEEEKEFASVKITNITGWKNEARLSNATGPAKTSVTVRLNHFGILSLESIDSIVEEERWVEVEEPKKTTKATNTSNETTSEEAPKEDATEKPKKKKVLKHQIDYVVNSTLYGPRAMNEAEKKKAFARLKRFDEHEELIRKTAEAKNNLESMIYKIRDYVENSEFVNATNEEARQELQNLAKENDDWLEGDESTGAVYEDYQKRFKNINKKVKPVLDRMEAHRLRPAVITESRKQLADLESKINSINKTKPWIPAEGYNATWNLWNDTKHWFEQKVTEQDAKFGYEEVVFVISDVKRRIAQVKQTYTYLRNTPKPKETNTTAPTSGRGRGPRKMPPLPANMTYDVDAMNATEKEFLMNHFNIKNETMFVDFMRSMKGFWDQQKAKNATAGNSTSEETPKTGSEDTPKDEKKEETKQEESKEDKKKDEKTGDAGAHKADEL